MIIRTKKLSWLSHILKSNSIATNELKTSKNRSLGRPKPRELDKAEKDLETLRVRNYIELLLDRDKWNVYNIALSLHEF